MSVIGTHLDNLHNRCCEPNVGSSAKLWLSWFGTSIILAIVTYAAWDTVKPLTITTLSLICVWFAINICVELYWWRRRRQIEETLLTAEQRLSWPNISPNNSIWGSWAGTTQPVVTDSAV